jgi:acyl-CoA synthetase (AMP-forming)/AMP-acid ligase II
VGVLVTVGQASGAVGVRYEDLVETTDAVARFGPLRPTMVLNTSGTTGAPRGVPPLDPAAADVDRLMRYLGSVSSVPPTPDGAVVLLTLPVHHGAGAGLATAACAVGGTVVVLDPYDPEEARRLIERHRVQSWTGVPTMLLRIQALPADVVDRYDLTSLVALNTGAAPVPQSLKAWIVGRLGEGMLWEGYGASEAGIVAGGVNIYPAEIENVLVERPDVVHAAVIGVPEPDFGEQPLAFIVSRPGSGLGEGELLAFLDGRLASYQKPRRFVSVDELPLNPTGKVSKDRAAGAVLGGPRTPGLTGVTRFGRFLREKGLPFSRSAL